ncbi:hypothetical protein LEN26_001228 [Aphanomyces euteiches]|nr:hypothetical protein AeMF1_003698 [Aphanomyces euteiches]KAH9161857.1 hypothetical protein LEN26_001228 [Aphanomyces euteiches]KAH9188719.1 hypothetical protein AeNC1_009306 [Aphanomyces euteiches]
MPPVKLSIAFLLNENAERRRCKEVACYNYIASNGYCIRHGGGKRCMIAGCSTGAKHYGLCWRHGGSKACIIPHCTKRSKSFGFCWAHGGVKGCAEPGCAKMALKSGENVGLTAEANDVAWQIADDLPTLG